MKIFSRGTLRDFWLKHAECEQQLKSWYHEVKIGGWRNINELLFEYPGARSLTDNKVSFRIKGNKYRLIVKMNYDYQLCFILFIGTHAEYNKIKIEEL